MPSLAERRAQLAERGNGGSSNGEYIRFKTEGESRMLRFLFTDATTIESHRKFYNPESKSWEIDGDRGSYKVTFNCVEYGQGGSNPVRCRFEVSEFLYNEYLAPYLEKDTPASKNVWEIKVRRPGTTDISFNAFKVEGATELTYPIPAQDATQSQSQPTGPRTPSYAAPVSQPQQYQQPVASISQQQAAPVSAYPQPVTPMQGAQQPSPTLEAPKKSKYF